MVPLYSSAVQNLLYLDFYNKNMVYILIFVLENHHNLIYKSKDQENIQNKQPTTDFIYQCMFNRDHFRSAKTFFKTKT